MFPAAESLFNCGDIGNVPSPVILMAGRRGGSVEAKVVVVGGKRKRGREESGGTEGANRIVVAQSRVSEVEFCSKKRKKEKSQASLEKQGPEEDFSVFCPSFKRAGI